MGNGGKITIEEETGYVDALGRGISIRITDNGPGVPHEIRDKIFDPFFTDKDEGSGLGLSIAARIIEEHGGRLDLVPTDGEGASFIITLPI
jgi:signal transduction histidine kinase